MNAFERVCQVGSRQDGAGLGNRIARQKDSRGLRLPPKLYGPEVRLAISLVNIPYIDTASILVLSGMPSQQRKVTVMLPDDLLEQAQKTTGKGVTATIRKGLELVAAREAARKLRKLRGKVRFSIRLETIREDRT